MRKMAFKNLTKKSKAKKGKQKYVFKRFAPTYMNDNLILS
jgi:hypothetical protein